MSKFSIIPAVCVGLGIATSAHAGCLTGAAAGAVVGHVAGHHALPGAGPRLRRGPSRSEGEAGKSGERKQSEQPEQAARERKQAAQHTPGPTASKTGRRVGPGPHSADYRTPVKGLYQCGSSAHPGGGVGVVVGHNAAREILRDRRR